MVINWAVGPLFVRLFPVTPKSFARMGCQSGGIGRFNERGAVSLCYPITERECKGTAFFRDMQIIEGGISRNLHFAKSSLQFWF